MTDEIEKKHFKSNLLLENLPRNVEDSFGNDEAYC